MKSPGATAAPQLSRGSPPGTDTGQDLQHPPVISGPSVQDKAITNDLQSPAPSMHSARLSCSEADGWLEKRGFYESKESTSTSSVPCCRVAGEAGPAQSPHHPQWAETDLFSATTQECGLRWSSRCWKESCNKSHPPRKIPTLLTKGKEQEQPVHSQIYGPQQAGKKSSEHFSKSSLCQKLQSDRCKSLPDPQLLPLLSQPQAAGEVTLTPWLQGWQWGRCRRCWVHHRHVPSWDSVTGQARAAAGDMLEASFTT